MLRIDFTGEDIEKLHYERYHYPHPLVQRKMEVIYLKSQGLAHQDIRTYRFKLEALLGNNCTITYLTA